MNQEITRIRGALAAIRPAVDRLDALTAPALPVEVYDVPAMVDALALALALLAELAADAAGGRFEAPDVHVRDGGQCPAGIRDDMAWSTGMGTWGRCQLPAGHDLGFSPTPHRFGQPAGLGVVGR